MYNSALILGLGASGEAASGLLLSEGTSVTVVDCNDDSELSYRAQRLHKKGAHVILNCSDLPKEGFEICIASPGVPADSDWIKIIESRGIEVLSELELGSSRCKCPILAITGSNGKSTAAKLCGDALISAGRCATLAGNYGLPICEAAVKSRYLDWMVVEVSSFQLERVKHFRPRVGVLLNVQPDHLDRHGNMKTYVELKSRLFTRMGAGDIGIVLDKVSEKIIERSKGRNRWVAFGLSKQADYRYEDGTIHFANSDGLKTISLKQTIFENRIMGVTAAAVVAAARTCGLDSAAVEDAVKTFEPLPHRMREITRVNNVRFVDDSKATNLAALHAGLEMSKGAVRLISGGILKQKNLKSVKKILAKKVLKVYLIGTAALEMEKAWRDVVQCCPCGHLEKAAHTAWLDAEAGETVLLSPGCASFDQFRNFEDRGSQFIRIVNKISKGDIK